MTGEPCIYTVRPDDEVSKNETSVFLEIDLPGGRSIQWFDNAVEARRALLVAAKRMRCARRGNGVSGVLVRVNGGTPVARYEIGVEK